MITILVVWDIYYGQLLNEVKLFHFTTCFPFKMFLILDTIFQNFWNTIFKLLEV